MYKTQKTKNRLPELRVKSVAGIRAVTGWTADKTVEYAKALCPVSSNNAPGHAHMKDTIKAVWRNQYRKDAFVGADYGIFVNFGTIYMPANPFWTMAHEQVRKDLDQALRLYQKYVR